MAVCVCAARRPPRAIASLADRKHILRRRAAGRRERTSSSRRRPLRRLSTDGVHAATPCGHRASDIDTARANDAVRSSIHCLVPRRRCGRCHLVFRISTVASRSHRVPCTSQLVIPSASCLCAAILNGELTADRSVLRLRQSQCALKR